MGLRFRCCRLHCQFSPSIERPPQSKWVVSSAVEHYLDMVGVTGSIPVPPTIFLLKFNKLDAVRKCEMVGIGILWRRRGGKFE
jgi:hypothetical protein